MRFVFYPQSLVPFHAKSLDERPLGGTETGVIRLADALHSLGHKVAVFTSEKNPPKSDPPYYHLSQVRGLQGADVFISIREWIPLVYPIPTRKRFLWTGDAPDQVHNFGIGDKRVASLVDGVLTVSDWHSTVLSEASGLPPEKCFALRNGIHLPYFEGSAPTKRGRRLVYSSTPFRGLEHLVRLFPKIRSQVPDAELHIFSGFDVYKGQLEYSPEIQAQYKPVFDALLKMDGVVVRGNVPQQELAAEFLQSRVLAYPNTFPETSCMTVMEAQASGVIPVTTARAALPETVGEYGVTIPGEPGEEGYDTKFIETAVRYLKSDSEYQTLREKCANYAKSELGWEKRAERFVEYLRSQHGLS